MPNQLPGHVLSDESGGISQFTTTHWSVILEAAQPESPGSVEAFGRLYQDYWYPLYAFLRRRGRAPHEAEDLLQGFFLTLLERERLRGLARDGGRFRSFLLKALQNYLANDWRRATAQRRGGGMPVISLDEIDAESRYLADTSSAPPEAEFERQWAFAVLANALAQLEAEMRAAGKEGLFAQLRPLLQGDRSGQPYAQIAVALQLSEGAVKVAVHRLRQRYGELLRAEVARTVGDPSEVAEELRHLMGIVSA
jgi:RNA polymerase sigma-70 factor (ECF subfamily)